MKLLRYIIINIIGTLCRLLPISVNTGIVRIGNPDKDSPVLVTCNYLLTVERLKKYLKGIDCFLLIVNSRGINVWCAATGGHFTNHNIISVLKTSGIDSHVTHRRLILPQLAASGIEPHVIYKKTGWHAVWGPVDASDIPEYIANGYRTNPEMRRIRFTSGRRSEMAIMWAFPISIIVALVFYFIDRAFVVPYIISAWLVALLLFLAFPIYKNILQKHKMKSGIGYILGLLPIIMGAAMLFVLAAFVSYSHDLNAATLAITGGVALIVSSALSVDILGSTPVFKSSTHPDRYFQVTVNPDNCTGTAICVQVCPQQCIYIDRNHGTVEIVTVNCVQCAACIVQCPMDALYFEGADEQIVLPDVIRKYKLNLSGYRSIGV